MDMGLWELAAGCGSRMQPSWLRNDWTGVAEVMAVGRRLQSLMVLGRKELNRTG